MVDDSDQSAVEFPPVPIARSLPATRADPAALASRLLRSAVVRQALLSAGLALTAEVVRLALKRRSPPAPRITRPDPRITAPDLPDQETHLSISMVHWERWETWSGARACSENSGRRIMAASVRTVFPRPATTFHGIRIFGERSSRNTVLQFTAIRMTTLRATLLAFPLPQPVISSRSAQPRRSPTPTPRLHRLSASRLPTTARR